MKLILSETHCMKSEFSLCMFSVNLNSINVSRFLADKERLFQARLPQKKRELIPFLLTLQEVKTLYHLSSSHKKLGFSGNKLTDGLQNCSEGWKVSPQTPKMESYPVIIKKSTIAAELLIFDACGCIG